MDRLWAPWRLGYVQGSAAAEPDSVAAPRWLNGADPNCFLCRAAAEIGGPEADRRLMVVARGPTTLTILNRFPYNNGHLLVAPLGHLARLGDLPAETQLECMSELARLAALLEKRMNAQGFNIGLNLGAVAGAGVPGHLHWHLVPRWHGDTNFMPVLAGIKAIPQALDALWELLTAND